ncbi:restriction endonuclease subunit S [Mariniflexile maritimum]|uniref:restriction endonuclease subunit S n=1 Tax=Mariniflexile maritimum TaxID=2682493 RepID=UPI0012F6985C|nr:restriction endonuclease subunit S [Mariniflexile maritimum]
MELVELDGYIEILSGYAFDSNLFNDKGDGVPLIRIRDVGKNISNTYYPGEYNEKFIVKDGDFLIGMDGDFRLSEWQGGKALLNQRVCKIWSKNRKALDDKYLLYFLPKELKLLEDTTSFATVKHLSVKKIQGIKIPLPTLETQKRIAAILDEADTLRQLNHQLIAKYDALTQSLFLDMFGDPVTNPMGWEKKKLAKFVSKLGDGIHGTPVYDENGTYYFVNGNNLEKGSIMVNSKTKTVTKGEALKHHRDLNEYTFLVSINGSIGKVAFYNNEKIMLGKSACYFNIIPNEINKIYLYYLIDSDYFLRYATGEATGSTIKNVSLKTMRNFPVLNPPIHLQTQFAERVQLIEQQKQQAQDALQKSEQLFNSLLQRAFKGAL